MLVDSPINRDYIAAQYPTQEPGKEVSVREFKSHLSSYLARAQESEELVITSHKHPVARVIGLPGDVPAGLMHLLRTGEAEWRGGKPKGGKTRPVISGKTMAEMMLEDRG